MTRVNIPAPLVRAFRDQLAARATGGVRRRFLDRVALAAAGPTPKGGSPEDPTTVILEDGVALAVAVVDQFTLASSVDVPEAEPLELSGRAAARELAERLRRRVPRCGHPR